MKTEKRVASDDAEDVEFKRPRTENTTETTESILDDIRLEEIESRIKVHVLESPASCTHEVAVYPGENSITKWPTFTLLERPIL